MCSRVPFHHEALANSDDLREWADMFLKFTPEVQGEQTDLIRREINLANMKRDQAGMTTRVDRPNVIIAEMDISDD
jgi:hypothetical protein